MEHDGKRNTRVKALSPIGERITDVLAASLERDPSTIKPDQHLRDDLGLDSLRTFELLYDLERAFDLEIPNDDLPGLQTLADVITYVEARVPARAQADGSAAARAGVPSSARPVKGQRSTAQSKKRADSPKATRTKKP